MITYLVISFALLIIAGAAEGVMDHLQFHYTKPNHFWNPEFSWKNKYKGGDKRNGEKFFLSSSLLVWLTDGWHLMKFIRTCCLSIGVSTILSMVGIYWLYSAVIGLGFMIVFKGAFTLVYNFLKST